MDKDNILRSIRESMCKYSDKESFIIGGDSYSYQDLSNQVARISCVLNGNKQCVGIIENDDIYTYASILAVLFTGNTYVILNPHNPNSRNKKIVESTSIKTILTSINIDEYTGVFGDICISSINLKEPESDYEIPLFEADKDDNAYIIFTSGSTGEPKGVPITYGNLNSFYCAYKELGFNLDSTDRMLQMFDLAFDVSVVSTLYPLAIGASVYTVPLDAVKYTAVYELLEDEELTFAAIPPSILSILKPYFSEIDLPKLKYLILTAEASHVDIVKEFYPSIPNAEVVNLYGPSEATIYCTSYFATGRDIKNYNGMLSIGKAFSGIDFLILKEDDSVADVSEKGEFCISGSQVMHGYWKNIEKTQEVFIQKDGKKYYRTGDVCYIDSEGDIMYCGRKDHQVQINGFRVELSEIEHYAKQIHKNGASVVIPKENSLGNLVLHLFLENYSEGKEKIHEYLKEHLNPYMCPKEIHILDSFPLNNSGKIDRKILKASIK